MSVIAVVGGIGAGVGVTLMLRGTVMFDFECWLSGLVVLLVTTGFLLAHLLG